MEYKYDINGILFCSENETELYVINMDEPH